MIVAVINNKGGTGKTTTTVNLGAVFAELGYTILLIDLDPQGSASLHLGVSSETSGSSLSQVLFDGLPIRSAIRCSKSPGLDLLMADRELYNTDLLFAKIAGRENRLRSALEAIEEEYDFILLDCPPYFSMVSVNALAAAHAYILPVTPDYLPVQEIASMIEVVEELKKSMALDVELLGILMTMIPRGRRLFNLEVRRARSNLRVLREHFDEDVFATEIPSDMRLAEYPAHGSTVFGIAPSSHCARQYQKLAREFLQRCGALSLKAGSRRGARLRRLSQMANCDEVSASITVGPARTTSSLPSEKMSTGQR